jgi:hypothetical protein
MTRFDAEMIGAAAVTKSSVTSRLVSASLPRIVAHAINSTDAVPLKSALAVARRLRAPGDDLVVVASDQRLLRAARAEGLTAFDPETQDQPALSALIGPRAHGIQKNGTCKFPPGNFAYPLFPSPAYLLPCQQEEAERGWRAGNDNATEHGPRANDSDADRE